MAGDDRGTSTKWPHFHERPHGGLVQVAGASGRERTTVVLGWLRGNGSSAQNGKVIDGAHLEQAAAGSDALKPDLLPDDQHTEGTLTRHNILVAVKGDELDREIVSL